MDHPPGSTDAGYHRAYLPALTGVRAFAILWVLAIHYGRLLTYPEPLRSVAAAGTGAVTLFLILSGLVLTINYSQDLHSGPYFRARVARLAPVYFAGLGLGVIATGLSLHWWPAEFDDLIGSSSRHGKGIAAGLDVTGLQSWVPWPAWRDAFNSPAWTVSTEIGFYLCFPLIVTRLIPRLRTRRAILLTALGAFTSMLLVNVIGMVAVANGSNTARQAVLAGLYGFPLARLPECVLGCMAGLLILRREVPFRLTSSERARNVVLLLAAAYCVLDLVSAHVFVPTHNTSIYLNLDLRRHVGWLPAFVPALLALACGPTFLSPILNCRPVQALGLASYSLYLLHWPILQVVVLHQKHVGNPHPGVGWVAVLFAGTVGIALLSTRWFENPARRLIVQGRRPRVAVAS